MNSAPMTPDGDRGPTAGPESRAARNARVAMRPISPHTGMEIVGVDLREPLSDEAYREIRHALCDRGVIVFRNQKLEPHHQVAFSERFGPVPDAEFLETEPGHPKIGYIQKRPEETRNVGGNWHSDHSFDPVAPLGSVLYARILPDAGGDTLFANMGAAYDSLSAGMKKTLEGLHALHAKSQSMRADPRAERAVNEAQRKHFEANAHRTCVHPVVRIHPETGRKVLFINPTYTVRFDGWTEAESRPLLQYLFDHATRPENTCRYRWEEGSLAFWDNRSAIHYALNDYHGQRRLMHRCVVYEENPGESVSDPRDRRDGMDDKAQIGHAGG